jgi:hypothetical protein
MRSSPPRTLSNTDIDTSGDVDTLPLLANANGFCVLVENRQSTFDTCDSPASASMLAGRLALALALLEFDPDADELNDVLCEDNDDELCLAATMSMVAV